MIILSFDAVLSELLTVSYNETKQGRSSDVYRHNNLQFSEKYSVSW